MKRLYLLFCGLATACSQTGQKNEPDAILTTGNDIHNAVADTSPKPQHIYADRDGELYFYVAAVSEEDQKKGKAAGDVIGFRYIGERNGTYRLESGQGSTRSVDECSNPCRVIKTTFSDGSVQRMAFNEGSIVGSAFTDAFNGFLEPATASRKAKSKGSGQAAAPVDEAQPTNSIDGDSASGLNQTE